jgi:hypothetical protein
MSIDIDQPNNGKPDVNQLYMNLSKPNVNQLPSPPAYINSPKAPAYDFPSPPNGPPRFADPTAYDFPSPPNEPPRFAPPKEVVEGLLPSLSPENKQVVVGLLDYPTGPINPASANYDELVEIKKQIPFLSDEDKQYFKTIIGGRGGRRKRTRKQSRKSRKSRRKSRRRNR